VISVADVLAALAELERMKDDDEAAHSYEDDLRECVLRAIAEGALDAQPLAQVVLASSGIEFSRWCA